MTSDACYWLRYICKLVSITTHIKDAINLGIPDLRYIFVNEMVIWCPKLRFGFRRTNFRICKHKYTKNSCAPAENLYRRWGFVRWGIGSTMKWLYYLESIKRIGVQWVIVSLWNRIPHIALKCDRHLGSTATKVPVKLQSYWKSLNPTLAASRLHEVLL